MAQLDIEDLHIWTCVPPTLADIRSYGVDVFCWCNRCSQHAALPIDVLIAQGNDRYG